MTGSLNWTRDLLNAEEVKSVIGPGNVVLLEIEGVTEVFTGFGERGVAAEVVAGQAADEAKAYLASGAPIGRRLADQLMIPCVLAGKGRYLTMPLSRHSRTNLDVIRAFMDMQINVDTPDNSNCMVMFG